MILAIVNLSTGIVENVIVADSDYVAPAGFQAITSTTTGIGYTYDNGIFTPPAPTPAQLVAYARSKQAGILAGGLSVDVGTQTVSAQTDTASLVLLQGALTLTQSQPSMSVQWVQADNVAVTLTADQVLTIFNAVSSFIQATFTALAGVLAGIGAGSIAAFAQIDSAGWPANS